ncbi:TRAP transporter small permease [Chelativorans sp. AA-79]|uniref:TRAP transporter small permease n=1 Tax=Chelativorans sp. AA-79 TaxID=3028735 RepID=UPI0023F62249|nr:TRAP transporter small permease [Chelativorans sp. AA-79]WEX12062.1 TRAP transporter small permease [Chelativorans sp. AA-79]
MGAGENIDDGPTTGQARGLVGVLYRVIEAATVTILVGYATILLLQVALRYGFNESIFWSDEIVRFGLVWNVLLGAALVSLREGHIRVDMLEAALPPRRRLILLNIIDVIAIAFALFLLFYGFRFALIGSSQLAPSTGMSMAIPYAAIPCGAALILFFTSVVLVRRIRRARSARP